MREETALVLNAQEFGLEPSKAEQIEKLFVPMVARFKELEGEYNQIAKEANNGIDDKTCKDAKDLRLKYVKIRTGADAAHKAAKADLLIQTRAIDGVRNIIKFAVEKNETNLAHIEKHFEILEQERKNKLREEREIELRQYDAESGLIDLGNMSDEIWANFLTGVKTNYEARLAAERKAEEDRIAREKAEKEEQERIQIENERLRKEAIIREEALAKERAEYERQAKLKEAALAKERAILEAKLAAERAEADRLKKIEEERIAREKAELMSKAEAEARAAEAPDKAKLTDFANRLVTAKLPEVNTIKGKKLIDAIKEDFERLSAFILSHYN